MISGWFLAAALAATPQADKATLGPKEAEHLCLPTAFVWRGSDEDVRHVATVPVPDSYRRRFTVGGCNPLIRESLIDWNLSFGTERTTTAALAFLSAAYAVGTVSPERFPGAFTTAWVKAQLHFRDGAAIEGLSGDARAAAARLFTGRPAITRLGEQVDALDHYTLLATQYLRAAEFYRSASLLEQANRYASAVEAAADVIRRSGISSSGAISNHLGLSSFLSDEIDDVRMRHATTAALLSDDPTRLATAEAVMASYNRLVFGPIAEDASDNFEPICEDRSPATAYIAQACEAENNFDRRVISYFRSSAYLELAQAARKDCAKLVSGDFRAFDVAIRLIENERNAEARQHTYGYISAWPNYYDENLFALELAKATQAFRSPLSEGEFCGAAVTRAATRRALALMSAAQSPQRFRAAATLYLAADAKVRRAVYAANTDPGSSRDSAFLRHTLRNLDRIAEGDGGPD